jgi:phosphoserine phosphatase RsbU/P
MQEIIIPENVIKDEFNHSTERFHVIACWVGMGLNLIWFISDFFVLPSYALTFFVFRLSISLICAFLVLTRKQTKIDIYTCMFVLVFGISVQNAFMWSVMDLEHVQQHAIAYLVLFIGAGMLVLWELKFSIILVLGTILSNVIFYLFNSELQLSQFVINGGLLVLTVAIFSLFLIRTRYKLTFNEIKSRLQLAKSKEIIERENAIVKAQSLEISGQKDALQLKNREITDSITYAKRIQKAVIPREKEFLEAFEDGFVFFRPKDIVSGDFYWKHALGNKIYFAVADCTGHGVPGGFMTMLASTYLEESVRSEDQPNPATILNRTREKIISALNNGNEESKDGMDVILGCYNKDTFRLEYASANNTSIILKSKENQVQKLECDKQPCGAYPDIVAFTNHSVSIEKGDVLYLFTDGFPDQFGGPNNKKFRYRQLHEHLFDHAKESFLEQKNRLDQVFTSWKLKEDQTDDVLVVGIQLR